MDLKELRQESPAPSSAPVFNIDQARATRKMLIGFREGVREGTFKGKYLVDIAMGLQFLDNMVQQSQLQLDGMEKQMTDKANGKN